MLERAFVEAVVAGAVTAARLGAEGQGDVIAAAVPGTEENLVMVGVALARAVDALLPGECAMCGRPVGECEDGSVGPVRVVAASSGDGDGPLGLLLSMVSAVANGDDAAAAEVFSLAEVGERLETLRLLWVFAAEGQS